VLLENSNIPRYKGKNREIMMRSFKQSWIFLLLWLCFSYN
jgi:hypothetical protein